MKDINEKETKKAFNDYLGKEIGKLEERKKRTQERLNLLNEFKLMLKKD